MNMPCQISPDRSERTIALTYHSSAREKAFEHVFLGQLCLELLERGVDYSVLHAEVDKDGYDLVVEAGEVIRHIQLKVMIAGGARADVSVNTKLASKPSGCVVWLVWDPTIRDFGAIRWFGDSPGNKLPALGDRIARHSRANALGIKAERLAHRIVPVRRFDKVDNMGRLVDILFGKAGIQTDGSQESA